MRIGRCAVANDGPKLLSTASRKLLKASLINGFCGINRKAHVRRKVVHAQAPGDSGGKESAELRREQEQLENTLAELAKVAGRLSKEDQEKLSAVIADLGPLDCEEEENSDEGQAEYPKPVRDLYNLAGVLDAVPYDGTPIIKDGKESSLMPKLSRYQWSQDDVKDTGAELTDEEWAQFFANELGVGVGDIEEEGSEGGAWGTAPFRDTEDDFDIPPSFADDDVKPGDNVEVEPSGEVESMLALLESGRPLPPDPREAGTTREDAAAFTARLDKIVARYESQFLKRHEWQITTNEIREMEERWDALAMTSDTPAVMQDITEVVPAPDFPPEIQQQWDRCQWILYRLRRAHLDGPPAQPAQALASAGLVAEDVIFQDALLECRGLPAWLEYAQRVEQTGGYIELSNIWGSASEDRPDPQWHIVVDSWLNIPYPDWYLEYFRTHFDAMKNPQLFLGAFAAALADIGAEVPEDLTPYADWADRMRRPHKREKKVPLLTRDAYEGRPLSLLQRMRRGSVPVVEADPNLSIDDADAQGRPLPGTEGPPSAASFCSHEFVAHPSLGEAPFAQTARYPYGAGRNLLLPLFRRLQQSSLRLLNLLNLAKSARSAIGGCCASAPAATPASTENSSAPGASADLSNPTASGQHSDTASSRTPTSATSSEDGTAEDSATADASGSAGSGDGVGSTYPGTQRYSVSTAEAVDTAGRTVQEWKRERAEHISRRSSTPDPIKLAGEPSTSASQSRRSSATAEAAEQGESILERLRGSWRAVKPGVSVWTDTADISQPHELLARLSELGASGDPDAQVLAQVAKKRAGFLRPERPRQTAVQEDGPSPTERSRTAHEVPRPERSAVSPQDEREAAAFSVVAREVRRQRRTAARLQSTVKERVQSGQAGSEQGWSRRSLSSSGETSGPELRLLGAADLAGMHGRVRVVADGTAIFASAAGGPPETHRYRLLLPSIRSALTEQTRLQQAAYSPLSFAAPGTASARAESTDASAGISERARQGEGSVKPTEAQEGLVSGGDHVAAAAAKLGLRPGGGSLYFPSAEAPLPAVPDLVNLFLGGGADIGDDVSSDIGADDAVSTEAGVSKQASGVDAEESISGDCAEAGQAGGGEDMKQAGSGGGGGTESEEEAEQRAPLGMAWRGGRYMTIPMTTLYELNVETGQVDRITCHWNGMIAHVLGGPEDARDVYVRQTRLHELMYRPGFRICYKDLDLTDIPADQAMDMS